MGPISFTIQIIQELLNRNLFSFANVHRNLATHHQGEDDPLSVDKLMILVSIILRLNELGWNLSFMDMGNDVEKVLDKNRVYLDEIPISESSRKKMNIDDWFTGIGFEDQHFNLENINTKQLLELGQILIPSK